jgi:hypothetical protein
LILCFWWNQGHSFSAPVAYPLTIVAGGTIILNTSNPAAPNVTADGITANSRPLGFIYFPLEEAFVDATGLLPPLPILNVGALMGAFVPEDEIEDDDDDPGFLARNDDPDPDTNAPPGSVPDPPIVGHIPLDALFLVGSGPFSFEAPEDGTLFLGVNDGFTPNNTGEFTVFMVIESDDEDDED